MVYNFSAGPAVIYKEVLKEVQSELLDFRGQGFSLLEDSHRGVAYKQVHSNAIASMKELLGLGDDHEVLLLGGGATLQFAMLAYNFLQKKDSFAQYVVTGSWGKGALKSAKKIGSADMVYDGSENSFTTLPNIRELKLNKESAYVHITSNETIAGLQWKDLSEIEALATEGYDIVADMSSDILSRSFDASKYSLIYAGAQKNLGPSGVCVVIIKKSFLEKAQGELPDYLSYKLQAEKESMLNTPPVVSIWILERVLERVKSLGGVSAVEKINKEKAQLLYECIENSNGFYSCPVDTHYRSDMNVVFRLKTEELEKTFIEKAAEKGLVNIKGHRSVGGCRASIYNAMPVDGVKALVDFMNSFKKL